MKLALVFLLFISSNVFSASISKSSFAIQCFDDNKKSQVMPLSYFEFADQIENKVKSNTIATLESYAPATFKSLNADFKNLKTPTASFSLPSVNEIEPLIEIPKNCKVLTMLKADTENGVVVNQDFWNALGKDIQDFFKLDFLLQNYLNPSLSKADFRRFGLFISKGQFEKYALSEQIDFFKFYGINEYFYGGISLDVSRDLNFTDDQSFIQDAFPFKGATYSGALINQDKFVTFSRTKSVIGIATTTPFSKTINGQQFEFVIPKNYPVSRDIKDLRFEPRMTFYEDGTVEAGVIKPVDHFFDLIKEMKSTVGYLVISFYPNHSPNKVYMGDCTVYMKGCEGSGTIVYNKKSFKVSHVEWHDNKNFARLIFAKHAVVEIPGNGTHDLQELSFDKDGYPSSAWPNVP